MPRICWPLQAGCPIIQMTLTRSDGTQAITRTLLADTGAGSLSAPFELVLSTSDCQQFRWRPLGTVRLGGAFAGAFPVYSLRVEIPALQWVRVVAAVAVPIASLPSALDGIAGFRFLNSFTYGNFSNPSQFCLESF